jgi:hypothetical protein
LFFMKAKLLKVLSSSTKPNTCTIAILVTFMYLLNFKTRRGKDLIFNHIWMIGFTLEVSYITTLALWLIVSFKWEAYISNCLESKILRIIIPPLEFFINTKCDFDVVYLNLEVLRNNFFTQLILWVHHAKSDHYLCIKEPMTQLKIQLCSNL